MTTYDEQFDFIVVGSGGGGLCAALYLARRGLHVAVLEKESQVGGTTARSGGVMWIPNNCFLRRDGIEDSEEKALRYLDALADTEGAAPGNSPERRRAYVRHASEMVEFLLGEGVELDRATYWPDYYDEQPGGIEEGRSVVARIFDVRKLGEWQSRLRPSFMDVPASLEELATLPYLKKSWRAKWVMVKIVGRTIAARLGGPRYATAGAALQGRMLKAALDAGVVIRTETPVQRLIEAGGRVTGVTVGHGDSCHRLAARRGVLVNAGGFSRNQAMRDRFQPGTSVEWSSAAPCDTGEMLEEMMRIGAATAQMGEMVGHQCTLPPGTRREDVKQGIQSVTAKPHAILVDQSGNRFMNEGGSYMEYCKTMLARHRVTPAVPSWAIFDTQYIDNYMLAGTFPGRRKPKRWITEGYLKRADSLEQLAQQIGADPAVLKATVERFNGFCREGVDRDFGRGERAYDRWLGDATRTGKQKTLGAIEVGPFYAVPVFPGDVGTYGGVVTDVHARVLREDGSVIEGLYATGVSTASVMGGRYPGAGGSVGPSFTWGYVAACHVATSEQASHESEAAVIKEL